MKPPLHEAMVRHVTAVTISHAYPEIVEEEVLHLVRKFKLVERLKKLEPGEWIDMQFKKTTRDYGWVEIRIDDRCTAKQ